jgi:hypothetical protein
MIEKGREGSLERFEYGVAELWSPADVWVVGRV